jgi:two-component system, OmpR family, phosphate regulon response regulator PhoB
VSGTPSVLLAEPDPAVYQVVSSLLRRRGYVVDHARSGGEAEARLRETLPDLLVAEFLLPAGSGVRLAELAKARSDARLPVVMLSALAAPIHRDYALAVGADVYLPKPFRVSALLAAAWRLCPVPPRPIARFAEAG